MCGNRPRARRVLRTERSRLRSLGPRSMRPRSLRPRTWLPGVALCCWCLVAARAGEIVAPQPGVAAPASGYAAIGGGPFESILPAGNKAPAKISVAPYALQRVPVTNAEFLQFVHRHPEWQRGRVSSNLADARYLQHWR